MRGRLAGDALLDRGSGARARCRLLHRRPRGGLLDGRSRARACRWLDRSACPRTSHGLLQNGSCSWGRDMFGDGLCRRGSSRPHGLDRRMARRDHGRDVGRNLWPHRHRFVGHVRTLDDRPGSACSLGEELLFLCELVGGIERDLPFGKKRLERRVVGPLLFTRVFAWSVRAPSALMGLGTTVYLAAILLGLALVVARVGELRLGASPEA